MVVLERHGGRVTGFGVTHVWLSAQLLVGLATPADKGKAHKGFLPVAKLPDGETVIYTDASLNQRGVWSQAFCCVEGMDLR